MFKQALEEIAEILGELALPYMVIGGQAVLLYGEPRFTRDIDITVVMDFSLAEKVIHAFQNRGYTPIVKDPLNFIRQTFVLPLVKKSEGIRVDLIVGLTPYEKEAIKRGNKVKIINIWVNFISLEDLVIHKIFSSRPRDIEDVEVLLRKNPGIDEKYIEKWLMEFERGEKKDLLETFRKLLETSRK